MNILKGITFIIASMFSVLAIAHHGWSSYDETKPRTETGVITDSGYDNPHGFIKLDTGGNKIVYIVLSPPSRMAARGLPKEALKPGSKATILGYQHRTNPDEMRAENITIEGKKTELRL